MILDPLPLISTKSQPPFLLWEFGQPPLTSDIICEWLLAELVEAVHGQGDLTSHPPNDGQLASPLGDDLYLTGYCSHLCKRDSSH